MVIPLLLLQRAAQLFIYFCLFLFFQDHDSRLLGINIKMNLLGKPAGKDSSGSEKPLGRR